MRTRDQIKADRDKRLAALAKLKTKTQKRAFLKMLKDDLAKVRAELAEIKQKRGIH